MIEKDELRSLVPHRGRMLLLGGIREYNLEERSLTAEYRITENCLFYDPAAGGVSAWVGFEYMAQAISALAGLRGREKGQKPKIGFILSISSMRVEIPRFGAGSALEIKVKERECIDSIHTFDGEVFWEGRKALAGKLMVIDVNDEDLKNFMDKGV